jgi:peroxiredoxin
MLLPCKKFQNKYFALKFKEMKKIFSFALFFCINTLAFAQTEAKQPEGLKIGDMAPPIAAMDQDGNKIDMQEMLKKGNVVLVFYRGQWCPYCNKQLSHLNDSLSLITAKGAMVIAITPETADNIKKTVEKTKTSFAIVEDKGLSIMSSYKVSFALDEQTIVNYKKYGIDLEKANGTNGANLPVPATYIIGQDGKIKYVFFNPDYTQRASIKHIIDNL